MRKIILEAPGMPLGSVLIISRFA
jgi:hypothetical protein